MEGFPRGSNVEIGGLRAFLEPFDMESFSVPRAAAGLVLGFLIGFGLFVTASMFGFGGHGNYLPMKLLCPYSILFHVIGGDWFIGVVFSVLVFMAYGASIGGGWPTIHRRKIMATCLVIHLLAVGVCLVFSGDMY